MLLLAACDQSRFVPALGQQMLPRVPSPGPPAPPAEVLGVQQESFTTPALLEETYPPTVFLDMQRDSSE